MPSAEPGPYPHLSQAIHLHPTAPLAERVLLPGDPGRALRLAQSLLHEPRMFNHNRGLWGYTGTARGDGAPLTIQATGMGGPSAAIVASELIDLGARRLLRVGTCGALDPALALGDLVVVGEALAEDGTSRALGARHRVPASPAILDRLADVGGVPPVPVVSTDLFYDAQHLFAGWAAAGARAVEMEAAALLRVAQQRDVEAACVLVVSDLLLPAHVRIDATLLTGAEARLGACGAAALSD